MREKLVLFIADAGMGKTEEMRYLAHSFSDNDPYMRPVFLQLNCYGRGSIEDYIYETIPEYKSLDPNSFLLIMDGYDEMAQREIFKQELKRYQTAYPDAHICISMRSNFFSPISGAFQGFSPYQLLELENADIANELQRYDINSLEFYSACEHSQLSALLRNPFYFKNILQIYQSNKVLPTQSGLIGRFVDMQFEEDVRKFEYVKDLDEWHYETKRALKRFAHGLQLLDSTTCDNIIYQTIIEHNEDRQLLKCSSLIINSPNGLGFSHNIF